MPTADTNANANTGVCTTCLAHGTECFFSSGGGRPTLPQRRSRTARFRDGEPERIDALSVASAEPSFAQAHIQAHVRAATPPPPQPEPSPPPPEESPLALASRDDQRLSLHIIGPTVDYDSQVLANYLAGFPGGSRAARMIVPASAAHPRPVLFTTVDKRPFGMPERKSVSAEKLAIIEKLLEPLTDALVDEYFLRSNACFPLLDQESFRKQYRENKERISPALLACLYASTLIYWPYSPTLSKSKCPDARFIWNLAIEATYSELYLSPGLSVINALILNIGGRPNTSLIGNGVLLASAVSMANSLGLNRSPLDWDIPQSEKCLRMKIWWALLVHDRWTSLAHGTPPHISPLYYDVPLPSLDHVFSETDPEEEKSAGSIYVALLGLTHILEQYLQYMFTVSSGSRSVTLEELGRFLEDWVDGLSGHVRLIILRGRSLGLQGAANLRLAYLSIRLLQQRLEIEAEKRHSAAGPSAACYTQARRTSEEILMFTQELQPEQLGDFWLPVTAFVFPSTVNFLLRCALETENTPQGLMQSLFFQVARGLMDALRRHQQASTWDLADVCLAQHTDIINRILSGEAVPNRPSDQAPLQEFIIPDASIMDQYFPSLWDPLQNAW
ncbi:fungal-specific transcription factor domain-containing protein [Stachybotrys elegans]|uniref:Fungal-specific transcription factor domain-containing protein n=1 Tax=Stachybotrys elegans TaxID=80388 RepID=A0A8K0SLK2_9HYPO|nr:fungal-specific transcription factor domain-containing protein [Stachybotrys elegans]